MELTFNTLDLNLLDDLSISYESVNTLNNVTIQLTAMGQTGLGEVSPHTAYGETQGTTLAVLNYLKADLAAIADPFQFIDILDRLDEKLEGHAATKAAIDMALYDLVGKLLGVPLYQLLGLNPEKTTHLTYTIGIDSVDKMVQKAIAASHYKYLKVKLGSPDDKDIITAIASATPAILRVDVNGGWEARHAIRFINEVLVHHPVEFVEQPLAPGDLRGMKLLHTESALPIVLDESISDMNSILRHADVVDGVNIKLMKCGGIRNALKMIHTARALGLKVMLGCRVETSLAITAAAHLTPLVDFADLDLHLLVAHDPFVGATLDDDGKFLLPTAPGLGVQVKP
jgi:L-alanine-DL-glutamate epimerase-like enolase superfamily enzyme